MDYESNQNMRERECNCCINIEDSFVLIVCGEIDPRQLRDGIKAFFSVKDTTIVAGQEDD